MIRRCRDAASSKKSPKRRMIVNSSQAHQPGFDDLGVPRCPVCHGPLMARLSRRGPVFFCQCVAQRAPGARAA